MKGYKIKLKNVDMLCNKCVMHVLKVLTKIEAINELEVDLGKRSIRIVLDNQGITRDMIEAMVKHAIEGINLKKISVVN